MDNEIENKTTNHKSKAHVDSNWILILFALVFIVVIAFLFQQTQLKEKEDFSLKQLNPSPPVIKIERYDEKLFQGYEIGQPTTTTLHELKKLLIESKWEGCILNLNDSVSLYNKGFHKEALLWFAVVSENILLEYLSNGNVQTPSVGKAINVAFKEKIISREEKDCLFKIKESRNGLVHIAGTEIEKERIDSYICIGVKALDKILKTKLSIISIQQQALPISTVA